MYVRLLFITTIDNIISFSFFKLTLLNIYKFFILYIYINVIFYMYKRKHLYGLIAKSINNIATVVTLPFYKKNFYFKKCMQNNFTTPYIEVLNTPNTYKKK